MRAHTAATLVSVALLLLCMSTHCAQAQQDESPGLFGMLKNMATGRNEIEMLDKPQCLITLHGDIAQVEQTLLDQVAQDKTVVAMIATKNDPTSVSAVDQYFKAVKEMCGEVDVAQAQSASEERSTFDDAVDVKGTGFAQYTFAYLSFDDEPSMMWRWWVWKVPLIAFVTRSTDVAQRRYDVQFWKIAWRLPNNERIVDALDNRLWRDQLSTWQSNFAPGGSLESVSEVFAFVFSGFYAVLDPIPNWLLTILGTMFGSLLISYMHRGDSSNAGANAASAQRPKGREAPGQTNAAAKKAQ